MSRKAFVVPQKCPCGATAKKQSVMGNVSSYRVKCFECGRKTRNYLDFENALAEWKIMTEEANGQKSG